MSGRSRDLAVIFTLCLFSRWLFLYLSGLDAFQIFGDAIRYDYLSERILGGNHDLDLGAFIVAPLYPYFLALVKLLFGKYWLTVTIQIQCIFISVSALYIYKTALLLFDDLRSARLAAFLYIIYPLTLWFNTTITQESMFQAFFIFFCFYFVKYQKTKLKSSLIPSTVFLGMAFLAKSHIFILFPVIAGYLILKKNFNHLAVFATVTILLISPLFIRNWTQYQLFSFSNYSSGSMLMAGHSDETYTCLTNKIYTAPEVMKNGCDLSFLFDKNHDFEGLGKLNALSPDIRNRYKLELTRDWILSHPARFFELKLNALSRFILPGLDGRIYAPLIYWSALILGLLIYVPAYLEIFNQVKYKEETVLLVLSCIIIIALIFLIFYPQNRFRVITLEPLLIVYASKNYIMYYNRLFKNRN